MTSLSFSRRSSSHTMVVGLMSFFLLLALSFTITVEGFQSVISPGLTIRSASSTTTTFPLYVVAPEKEDKTLNKQSTPTSTSSSSSSSSSSVEDTTEKYGLEVGLFESMKQKDGGESAKSLLKKYGIAYLATSIPLALISFAICYVLVDNGVDVGALLGKIGIESGGASETAGTFAIAYAAHKAASPIRFPPTVVLTPVVAKLIGKEPEMEE